MGTGGGRWGGQSLASFLVTPLSWREFSRCISCFSLSPYSLCPGKGEQTYLPDVLGRTHGHAGLALSSVKGQLMAGSPFAFCPPPVTSVILGQALHHYLHAQSLLVYLACDGMVTAT